MQEYHIKYRINGKDMNGRNVYGRIMRGKPYKVSDHYEVLMDARDMKSARRKISNAHGCPERSVRVMSVSVMARF